MVVVYNYLPYYVYNRQYYNALCDKSEILWLFPGYFDIAASLTIYMYLYFSQKTNFISS